MLRKYNIPVKRGKRKIGYFYLRFLKHNHINRLKGYRLRENSLVLFLSRAELKYFSSRNLIIILFKTSQIWLPVTIVTVRI